MNKLLSLLVCLLELCLYASFAYGNEQSKNVGVWLADAIIKRHQPTIDVLTGHGWDHSNSIVMHALEKVYQKNADKRYLAYIKAYADDYVRDDGSIDGLLTTLDGMHPGVVCLFLYRETGEDKYRLAAKNMRDHLLGTDKKASVFGKTPGGLFWHKNNKKYQHVVSVDGLYMKDPFLVRYGLLFDEAETVDLAIEQVLEVTQRSFNMRSNLPYHAWSYERNRDWSDPITGQSRQHWSRASGWFSMALVDILEHLPESHPSRAKLVYIFQRLAQGLRDVQHPKTGLWYQVLDAPQKRGNYPEMSGSGMIVYALQKGVKLNLLPQEFSATAKRCWRSMQRYIKEYADGGPQIRSVAPGMSAQIDYDAYVAIEPVNVPRAEKKQYSHGYIGVLMAASAME